MKKDEKLIIFELEKKFYLLEEIKCPFVSIKYLEIMKKLMKNLSNLFFQK